MKMLKRRLISLVLCTLMLLPALLTSCGNDEFDFMKEDLSKYITLTSDQYLNQTVEVEMPDPVDDAAVDAYVREILGNYGVEVYLDDKTVEENDIVSLYYRATILENGKIKELKTNYASGAVAYDLAKDTLSFSEDFNKNLIGISTERSLEKKTSGDVEEDQILYVTYSYSYKVTENGKDVWKTHKQSDAERWDLTELAEKGTYGDDFIDKMLQKKIGKSNQSFSTTFDANDDGVPDKVTFNLTILFAVEEDPVTFTLTYPKDYGLAEFKEKEVTFHVCINGVAGTADELLTEKIVKDTLKYKPEKDDEYKDDIVKSFLNRVRKTLQDSYDNTLRSLAIGALFESFYEDLKVKKYPDGLVDEYYDSMVKEARAYYEQYNQQIGADNLNDFVIKYYSLPEKTNYKTYFRDQAKDAIKYSLVYYTIVRNEGLAVTDEEYEKDRSKYMDEFIYEQEMAYYQQTGYFAGYTEESLTKIYGAEYLESTIRQAILSEKVNAYLYEHLTVEEKQETEDKTEDTTEG